MNPKDLKVTITVVPVEVPPMTLEEAQELVAQDFGERTQDLYHTFEGGYGSYGQEAELRAFRLGMATVVRVDERMRLALVWALEEVEDFGEARRILTDLAAAWEATDEFDTFGHAAFPTVRYAQDFLKRNSEDGS